jgi:type I restriction-modification system DNA methylase subunit
MNLLLHGLDAPQIDPGNALRFKLSEIGKKERVDVILTNPPFGGEEQKGIQGDFPEDRQTAETALLFLQLIMRKLHRPPTSVGRTARAAVVVPNGILYGDGICARIKQELLTDFNLHTIIRLPSGIFSPYTPIPTNILFFERGGPTKTVWYYELPLPEGRKKYSKTLPIQFEDFRDCLTWWNDRKQTYNAHIEPGPQAAVEGCLLFCRWSGDEQTSGRQAINDANDPTATSANPPAARYPNSPTSLLMCQLLAGGMPRDCRKCGGYSPGSGGVLEIEAARFYHVCLRCGCHLATRTPCVPPPYSADCWMG